MGRWQQEAFFERRQNVIRKELQGLRPGSLVANQPTSAGQYIEMGLIQKHTGFRSILLRILTNEIKQYLRFAAQPKRQILSTDVEGVRGHKLSPWTL